MIRGFFPWAQCWWSIYQTDWKETQEIVFSQRFLHSWQKKFCEKCKVCSKDLSYPPATWHLEFCAGLAWRKFLLVKSEIKFYHTDKCIHWNNKNVWNVLRIHNDNNNNNIKQNISLTISWIKFYPLETKTQSRSLSTLHLVATTVHCPMMVIPHRNSATKWEKSQINLTSWPNTKYSIGNSLSITMNDLLPCLLYLVFIITKTNCSHLTVGFVIPKRHLKNSMWYLSVKQ